MKIAILGTGYVGLVTGIGLANTGKNVICIDNDEEKVQKIKNGISPIYEPGLEELLIANKNRIEVTTNAKEAITKSDVIIIAVGTPFDGDEIDLSFIKQASKEIGEAINETTDFKVVVVKSTVVPETTENVVKPIVLEYSGKTEEEVGFAMNPEFLREGNAVVDFLEPDRIVLGVSSVKVEMILREMYNGYPDTTLLITNPTTAETIKYTANSLLALSISYSNEIARICEQLAGVDSEKVFEGVLLDKRFSPIENGKRVVPQFSTYLRAGIGFGGSCFPKDVKAFHAFAKKKNIDTRLLGGLLEINQSQLQHVFNLGINNHPGKPKKIAILGTAFKPNTDDIRESPGIKLAQIALERKFEVTVHDYIALDNTRNHFNGQVSYEDNPMNAIKGADLVYVTTIWDNYLNYTDGEYFSNMKKNALMIDTRSHFKDRTNKSWRIRIGVG